MTEREASLMNEILGALYGCLVALTLIAFSIMIFLQLPWLLALLNCLIIIAAWYICMPLVCDLARLRLRALINAE